MRRTISEPLDRRALLKAFAGGAGLLGASRLSLRGAAASPAFGAGDDLDLAVLKPGEFSWWPDRAPDGPLVIFVSIPKQRVFIYRNAALIGLSTCSTGMQGHSTPAGLFTVIGKFKIHRSIKYRDDMPNTLRLTRKGMALHGGDVPGYPVSHGCVHLPLAFADALFERTATGTTVVIGGNAGHALVGGPGIMPAAGAGAIVAAREAARSVVPSGQNADTAILVSAADRRIYLLQDGTIVAQGPVLIKEAASPLGTNVFVWRDSEASATSPGWKRSSFEPVPGAAVVADAALLERIDGDGRMMDTIGKLMHSGTVVLTTDEPLSPGQKHSPARSGAGVKRSHHGHRTHRRRRSG